jgi:stage V sporulation protein G
MQVKLERIYRVDGSTGTEKLKGFADINLDNDIIIKGLRVVEGKQGLFVGMPKELGKDGRWYDRVACLNDKIKEQITSAVMDGYNQE